MPRHDDGVSTLGYSRRELHVTSLLTDRSDRVAEVPTSITEETTLKR